MLLFAILPAVAFAQSPADTEEADMRIKEKLGIHLSLELNSIYNFRGLNFFQDTSQHDQHFALIPSATYELLDAGVWFNYRGVYQVTGNNISEAIDVGYGNEQDLGVGYTKDLVDGKLTFNTSFYYYFYPFAKNSAAGATCPSYIEPLVGVTYHTLADLSLNILYYLGIQSGVRDYSYLYVNPRIGRAFDIAPMFGIFTGAGFGYKLFKDHSNVKSNVFDIVVNLEFPIRPSKHFDITPALHYGWTNIRGRDFVKESMFYGGIKFGGHF